MLTKVRKTIEKQKLLGPDSRVVVAVSGGPDSVTLLSALNNLYPGAELVVAHVNYQSRGQDSEADEAFTRRLAEQLKLPILVKKIRLDKDKAGFEARAREVRYHFFEEVRQKEKADVIAVAHHSDDVVETMLLNLRRGAGPRGLAGMPYRRGDIVRPLLDVTRSEIESYLAAKRLSYREDKSNQDTRYRRNWVRHKLLPRLRRENYPDIDWQLRELAAKFLLLADAVEAEAARRKKSLEIVPGEYQLVSFLALSPLLQGEIIRELLGKMDISRRHVAEVIKLLESSESGKYKEFKGVVIEKQKDRFLVQRRSQ